MAASPLPILQEFFFNALEGGVIDKYSFLIVFRVGCSVPIIPEFKGLAPQDSMFQLQGLVLLSLLFQDEVLKVGQVTEYFLETYSNMPQNSPNEP